MPRARSRSAILLVTSLLLPSCSKGPGGPQADTGSTVGPVSHFHDLVAGASEKGFADGPFTRARFDEPLGLCQSPDGSRLYVADRGNHRIRVVRLSEANRVETLAGSGQTGKADGAFDAATFDHPSALVSLAAEQILAYDAGTGLFRRLDLKERTVKTVPTDTLPGVWSAVKVPDQDAVFFSQPQDGVVGRLDLSSGQVTGLLKGHPGLTRPAAMALHGGALVVADLEGTEVLQIPLPLVPGAAPVPSRAGEGQQLVALASSGGRLYGLSSDGEHPWVRVDRPGPVNAWSVNGGKVPFRPEPMYGFLPVPAKLPAGLLADSRSERALFASTADLQAVLEVRDYDQARRWNAVAGGPVHPDLPADDYTYPKVKAPGTTRMFLVGDSHLFHGTDEELSAGKGYERMWTIPKQVELKLATRAALEGRPGRYEVLQSGHTSWWPLLVWPAYEVPALAKAYDADLVVLMVPPGTPTLQAYIDRPITPEGIPAEAIDPEHLLKPWKEKLANNPARRLVELCLARGLARAPNETQVSFDASIGEFADIPELRAETMELLDRPLAKLARDLGKRTRLVLCFYPMGHRAPVQREIKMFRELCEKRGIAFLDVTDAVTALRTTYYPLSEMTANDHYNREGHALLAEVLSLELVRHKLIPF